MSSAFIPPRRQVSSEVFSLLVYNNHKYRLSLMNLKGQEYSSTDDKVANFKHDEDVVGVDRLQAWEIMFNKHVRSIQSFIKRAVKIKTEDPDKPWQEIFNDIAVSEPIEGRVADIQNYLDLFLGLLYERGWDRTLVDESTGG